MTHTVGRRLHLDLSAGARADMIIGALLAVGARPAAATAALDALGAGFVELRVGTHKRAGLLATCVEFLVDDAALAPPPTREQPPSRRGRHAVARPRLHSAQRGSLDAAASAVAVAPSAEHPEGGSALPPRTGARRPRAPGPAQRWAEGEAVGRAEVLAVILESRLDPVAKALTAKAARRAFDALAHVAGDDARLHGPAALRLLCGLAVGASLVDDLSPLMVTASPVALSRGAVEAEGVVGAGADAWPAPSPWLLEVLAGVPVVERDEAQVPSDVAGAALAWACVHRFGARGVSAAAAQGIGGGLVDAPGIAVVARALLGPPTPVSTRAGERTVEPMWAIDAVFRRDVDLAALGRALADAGARAPTVVDAASLDGERRVWVRSGAASGAGADAVLGALWRAGAVDVNAAWVETHGAGLSEVTVAVGRGNKKLGVRIRVWSGADGVVARVEPDADDVRNAAEQQGQSVQAVAADAVTAWEALESRGTGEGGDDGRNEDDER